MITIRLATETDTEILALLGRVIFSESHGKYIADKADLIAYNNKSFSIEQTKSDLNDPNCMFYIAFYDGFPVGYTKTILHAAPEDIVLKNCCRLERIYVLEEFLGKSIGRQLLNITLDKATQLQFNHIWLTVYIKNHHAIAFYEKNDFKNIGDYTFYVGDKGYLNPVLSKTLNP